MSLCVAVFLGEAEVSKVNETFQNSSHSIWRKETNRIRTDLADGQNVGNNDSKNSTCKLASLRKPWCQRKRLKRHTGRLTNCSTFICLQMLACTPINFCKNGCLDFVVVLSESFSCCSVACSFSLFYNSELNSCFAQCFYNNNNNIFISVFPFLNTCYYR